MGYSLVTGGDQWTEVASLFGMKDFREFVEGLSNAPELQHLLKFGWSQELAKVTEELTAAIAAGVSNDSAASVAQAVLAALKARADDAESAILSNGLSSDDDAPDDWSLSEEDQAELDKEDA